MHPASVGFHCPECARAGRQQVHTAASLRQANQPVITIGLIVVNVVAFLAFRPGTQGYVDGALIGGGIYLDVGAIGVDFGEWWRLITGGFLHANLMHIGFNMYLLYMLGIQLEPFLGRLRFGILYATSLLAGSFGVMLLAPDALTVGASGAVFGLMGAMLLAQRAVGIDPWRSGIGGLVALNLLITFLIPNISIGGHLGGFLGGALVGAIYLELPRRLSLPNRQTGLVVTSALAAAVGVACFVASLQLAGNWPEHFFS